MELEGIYISGFFKENDYLILDEYANQFKQKQIPFYVRNLNGMIMQAALDFIDYEFIAISYAVLQEFLISGGYDLAKHFFLKLWKFITKDYHHKVPFTISINGIPTKNGSETIKCKIDGQITDDMKMKAIEKTFELASQVEQHQFQLQERNSFSILEGHIFIYDSANNTISEMDIEKDIKKRVQKNK